MDDVKTFGPCRIPHNSRNIRGRSTPPRRDRVAILFRAFPPVPPSHQIKILVACFLFHSAGKALNYVELERDRTAAQNFNLGVSGVWEKGSILFA